MATSKLVPIIFLSCSSQSGSGEPQKPGKGTRIEIPEVGERSARLGTETAYHVSLTPDVPPLPFLTLETIFEACPQTRMASCSMQWRQEIKWPASDHHVGRQCGQLAVLPEKWSFQSSFQRPKFPRQPKVLLGPVLIVSYEGEKILLNVLPS